MRRIRTIVVGGLLMLLAGPMASARAELIMKLLIVNPSDTEVKEFDVRNPSRRRSSRSMCWTPMA